MKRFDGLFLDNFLLATWLILGVLLVGSILAPGAANVAGYGLSSVFLYTSSARWLKSRSFSSPWGLAAGAVAVSGSFFYYAMAGSGSRLQSASVAFVFGFLGCLILLPAAAYVWEHIKPLPPPLTSFDPSRRYRKK